MTTLLLRLGCTLPLLTSAGVGGKSSFGSFFCFPPSWFLRFRCSWSLRFFARSLLFRSLLLLPPPPTLPSISSSWRKIIISDSRKFHIQLPRRRLLVFKNGLVVEFQACLHSIVSFKFQKCKPFRLPRILFFSMADGFRTDFRKMLAY